MRIRQKEILKLHKRREDRYKALHKGNATPAPAVASTATSARAGAGGRTGNTGPAAGGRPNSGGGAARPPRRPAPTEA